MRQRSGVSIPAFAPDLGEFAHALLHGERHRDTGERVRLDAARLGIAEEHQDGVADIFVDRRAVLRGDLRHFGQILIEELGELLGLHLVGGLGEAGEIGEAYRQLLPLAGDPDILTAGEDRAVHLRREIFRQLAGKDFEGSGFLGQAFLPPFHFGDVGVDRDRAAAGDPPLADHDPAPVATLLHMRFAGIAMLQQAFGGPFLLAPLGIRDQAALGGSSDDRLERRAGNDNIGDAGIHDFAVAAVAEDEPILGVVESKAFGDAFDRIHEALARFGHLAQVLLLDLDGGIAEEPQRLGHAADLVAAGSRQRRPQGCRRRWRACFGSRPRDGRGGCDRRRARRQAPNSSRVRKADPRTTPAPYRCTVAASLSRRGDLAVGRRQRGGRPPR